MSKPKFVIYTRVSTKRQGLSGLGLDSQRKMCLDLISKEDGEVAHEFQDVESGTHRDRPGLWRAIEFCKANQCTLVIAKLDRLARDVEFTFKVLNSGIQIRFCDMPIMNTMILGVFATVAQYEKELIAGRTKNALSSIKDEIKKNGGHVSKQGRYITHLGSSKGVDTTPANMAAAVSNARRASDWREQSPLYLWAKVQLAKQVPRKNILAEAHRLYEKNPAVYCTRNGKPLSACMLSRWSKEL